MSPAQCLFRALELPTSSHVPATFVSKRHFSQCERRLAVYQIPSAARIRVPDKLAIFTRDEQIRSTLVRVKQSNGSIGREETLLSVLRRIDRRVETVLQLSKPGASTATIVEVAKIADLKQRVRDQEDEARRKQLAHKEQKPKQLELNWAISEHDLEMKLKQMEQFVSEGKKVEILLAGKKRARRATAEEAETALRKIRERLVEIDAKEVAPMEGVLGKQAILMVKSKKENITKTQNDEVEEEGESTEDSRIAARKAREEKREAARAKQEAEKERKEEERKRLLKEFPDWNQPQQPAAPPRRPDRPGYY